jgi:spore germination cell wall hydrolase CwlJ-like protein
MRQLLAAFVMLLIMVSGSWMIDYVSPIVPKIGPAVPVTINWRVLHSVTDKDIDCLAKNVYYEARGEETLGQYAVAEVTLNRWKNNPTKTLCQIVYQRSDNGCQFSWVCNPSLPLPSYQSAAWLLALDIAREFAKGKTCECNLNNAIYFHATYVQPSWARTKPLIAQIGKHKFYADNNLWQ